jgi:hypothetical protein
VHQVRIEVEDPIDTEQRGRLVEIADRWASACAAERHVDVPTASTGSI